MRPLSFVSAAIFGIALAALLAVALFPIFPNRQTVRVDDIASRTVKSPRDVSFQSDFLTEQARQAAAEAVAPRLAFDPGIRTEQLAAFDRLVRGISDARNLTDDARKREALGALGLSERSVETVIALPPDRWLSVIAEGQRVLSDELNTSLDEASAAERRDSVDSLIAPDFGADEAILAAEIVRRQIVPTQVVDEEATEAARQAARQSVPPQRVNVQQGDIILSAETRVDEVTIEKLEHAGVLSRSVEWRSVFAVIILSAIAGAAVAAYLYVLQPKGITSERQLIALAIVTMLPLLVAKFYLPLVLPDDDRLFLAFILPLAAAPMLIAALLSTEVAVAVSAIIGTLVALVSALIPDASLVASVGSLDTFRLLLVYAIGPLAGVFIVHRADRLNRYLTAGVAVAATTYAMLVATWLIDGNREPADLAWMGLVSSVGGVGSGVLAAGAFVTVGVMFGVTTRLQLMELSQLNAPLLRRLQDEAPGTFHHSVIVGNLAERAADLVGADPLLTRVGCYYHDIGKVLQPGMYIENQMGGASPHEDMTPEESAAAIQQHVLGGAELARREGLPPRVQAFIPEHHGTRLVAYFYRLAAEKDPGVDPAIYTYPGPRPQSKETAIVMLADSTEAVIRSSPDRSPERIDVMVEEVIAERVAEGQLDDSDLTLRDLRTIAESFKGTMRAVYHPRVQYPQPTALETRRRLLRLPMMQEPRTQDARRRR